MNKSNKLIFHSFQPLHYYYMSFSWRFIQSDFHCIFNRSLGAFRGWGGSCSVTPQRGSSRGLTRRPCGSRRTRSTPCRSAPRLATFNHSHLLFMFHKCSPSRWSVSPTSTVILLSVSNGDRLDSKKCKHTHKLSGKFLSLVLLCVGLIWRRLRLGFPIKKRAVRNLVSSGSITKWQNGLWRRCWGDEMKAGE